MTPVTMSPQWPNACSMATSGPLARAITLIESDDPAGWELVREVYRRPEGRDHQGLVRRVGKSTLIGASPGSSWEDRQVAVLSIDPSSPFHPGCPAR